MGYSVGLTLYNLAGRGHDGPLAQWTDRPKGPLVWLHAPKSENLAAMTALAQRLIAENGVAVVLTAPEPPVLSLNHATMFAAPPQDTTADTARFLDYWTPSLIVFCGNEIRPALIHEAQLRKLPMLLVDGRGPQLMPGREGWYPGLIKTALTALRQILVVDDAAAKSFRKAGAEPAQIQTSGRLEEQSAALPYLEAERFNLAQSLATRPIWLAAAVPEIEEAAVIAAHREALRLSHRLLLILVPHDPARATALGAELEGNEGWQVALRSADQEPVPETEVYIPDSASEFGLWYRLAPVTFLGGSLLGDGCARNPMEPAALGSAILYGPRSGLFGAAYGRLGAARAARAVGSATDLAQALGDLLSPDRAARLAQAAWTVASEGVDVTDKVLDLIGKMMDRPQ